MIKSAWLDFQNATRVMKVFYNGHQWNRSVSTDDFRSTAAAQHPGSRHRQLPSHRQPEKVGLK